MKKVYVKPVLIKLGNLEAFIKGMGGANGYLDIYSNSSSCIWNPGHPKVLKLTCGATEIGTADACGLEPGTNYFVVSRTDFC